MVVPPTGAGLPPDPGGLPSIPITPSTDIHIYVKYEIGLRSIYHASSLNSTSFKDLIGILKRIVKANHLKLQLYDLDTYELVRGAIAHDESSTIKVPPGDYFCLSDQEEVELRAFFSLLEQEKNIAKGSEGVKVD